jgi:hypothetical protein
MKSQAKKAIALSSGAGILVLAVGFSDGGLLPSGTTTTTTPSFGIAPASRPPPLSQDLALFDHPGDASRYALTLKTGQKIMAARQHAETRDPKRPRDRASLVVPKLTQGAVIGGADAPVTASTVGDAHLARQAHADDPPCVADPTNLCPPPVDVSADSPSRPRTQIICQPAGMFGQFCYRRKVP